MASKNVVIEFGDFIYSITLKYSRNSFIVKSFEQLNSLNDLILEKNKNIYFNFNFTTVRRVVQVQKAIAQSDGLKHYLLTHIADNKQNTNRTLIAFRSLIQPKHQQEVSMSFDIIDQNEFVEQIKTIKDKNYFIESLSNIELTLPLLANKLINDSSKNSIFAYKLEDSIYLFVLNKDHYEYLYHIKLQDTHLDQRLEDSCGYIFRTYGDLIGKNIICLNDIDSSIFDKVKDEYNLEISFANIIENMVSFDSQTLSQKEKDIVLLAIATVLSEKTDANLFIEQKRKRRKKNIIFGVFSIVTVLVLLYQTNILYQNWNQLEALSKQNTQLTKQLQEKLMDSSYSLNMEQLNYIEQLTTLSGHKDSKLKISDILQDINLDNQYKFLHLDMDKKQIVFNFEFKHKDLKSLYILKDKLLKEFDEKYTKNEASIQCTSDVKTLTLDMKIIHSLESK